MNPGLVRRLVDTERGLGANIPIKVKGRKLYALNEFTEFDIEYFPSFFHWFYDDGEHHTYKGSLKRHVCVERLIMPTREWLVHYDATIIYRILNFFIDLILGLNCGFPAKDVMSYAIWDARPLNFENLKEDLLKYDYRVVRCR